MKTYVFDLDGTLCVSSSSYKDATPIIERIEMVNSLKRSGYRIVIFTARGMSTYRGVALIARLRWGLTTRKQLIKWGLKYDKLILGKPGGDIYVDDKGINAEAFFPPLQ